MSQNGQHIQDGVKQVKVPESTRSIFMTANGQVWNTDEEYDDLVRNLERFLVGGDGFYRTEANHQCIAFSRQLLQAIVHILPVSRLAVAGEETLQALRFGG